VADGDIWRRLDKLPFAQVIGHSTEGRPIRIGRFGPGTSPAALLLVAGVHGDEGSSVEAVADLVERLATGDLVAPQPFWLIPVLNPDGLARGQKNSARNVDLNRNFAARNFSVAHEAGYFPGETPLSEPETRALADFLDGQPAIDRAVAVHAPFACVNFDGPAADWAAAVSRACGWPVQADIGYPTPGSLGSWLGYDRGWPILTLELPPGPLSGFAADCRGALAAAVGAGIISGSTGDCAGA
jgi:protein MpaA